MAETINQIKIFLASPSGLESLRKLVREEIDLYSETEGENRGVRLKAVCCEDICKGMGNPQEQINPYLCACHYYLLILHNRWGTPPSNISKYDSGSEVEFHLAYTCYKDKEYPMQDIIVLFKKLSNKEKGNDIPKIKAFRKKLVKANKLYYDEFKNRQEFVKIIRTCLAKWLKSNEKDYCPSKEPPKSVLDFFEDNQ